MNYAEYKELQRGIVSRSRASVWGELAAARVKKYYAQIKDEFFEDDSFIDFGGNDGLATEAFKEVSHCQTTMVIDLLEDTVATCHEYGLPAIQADLASIPLPDSSYDWGFCSNTLEHVLELDTAISEIHRIVRRACLFIVPLQTEARWKADIGHMHGSPDVNWWLNKFRAVGFTTELPQHTYVENVPMPDVTILARKAD